MKWAYLEKSSKTPNNIFSPGGWKHLHKLQEKYWPRPDEGLVMGAINQQL